jgi:hypothetical protein
LMLERILVDEVFIDGTFGNGVLVNGMRVGKVIVNGMLMIGMLDEVLVEVVLITGMLVNGMKKKTFRMLLLEYMLMVMIIECLRVLASLVKVILDRHRMAIERDQSPLVVFRRRHPSTKFIFKQSETNADGGGEAGFQSLSRVGGDIGIEPGARWSADQRAVASRREASLAE